MRRAEDFVCKVLNIELFGNLCLSIPVFLSYLWFILPGLHIPLGCRTTGRISIAWLKERISQHYSMAKDTKTERGKDSILPPAPNNSFLGGSPNRLAHASAQFRTGH
jgi:hypothetical protein